MLRIGETVDRYVVEALIGQGGMAAVYRARHSTLDSLHAIKVLFITAPEIRTRLMREGKVQANLRHPNIVAVTDVLEIQGAPALVMEYVDGPPLDQWLAQNRPTLQQALFIFRGVLKGVMEAHERGVIHRDLKPANVLLANMREGVVPKVADFGLTKSVKSSSGHTQTGMAMGTPEYMAPEQIRDASDVDERVDMFALGCILYEMCCGQRAFEGPDNVTIFNSIVNGVYPNPKELVDDLPRNITMALKWLLEPDRDKRLGSATELYDLLFEDAQSVDFDMSTTPAEPISISTTINEPTPLPPPSANIATQPPPSMRMATPAGQNRRMPLPTAASEAPTDIPLDDPSSGFNMVRLVMPLIAVLAIGSVVGVVMTSNPISSSMDPDPSIAAVPTPNPLPRPTVTPEPGPAPTVDPDPEPSGTPEPGPTSQPDPRPTQPVPAPAETPRPPPVPAPTTTPDPGPAPKPEPVPDPEPAAASGTRVQVSGDARGVWLVGGGGRVKLPASVAAGDYSVEADFGEGAVVAGQVSVRSGQGLTLNCTAFLFQCRPQ